MLAFVLFGWEERNDSGTGEIPAGNWVGGLGGIAFGAKRAFFHSARTGTIFSVSGEIILPTGDRKKGVGKGTTVFELFVSFGQILPSEFFVQAQAGFELPVDTDLAGQEAFWRFSLGRTFTSGQFGRAWSPMCEFLGARELEFEAQVQWDLVPQMQIPTPSGPSCCTSRSVIDGPGIWSCRRRPKPGNSFRSTTPWRMSPRWFLLVLPSLQNSDPDGSARSEETFPAGRYVEMPGIKFPLFYDPTESNRSAFLR